MLDVELIVDKLNIELFALKSFCVETENNKQDKIKEFKKLKNTFMIKIFDVELLLTGLISKTDLHSVSYTRLTLPTIYSV